MWNTCGPDTVHLTFKEGGGRTPTELACLLEEFQKQCDLPTHPLIRDRGVQGFANAAVDEAAGLRLDWTRPNEEGNNAGFFCLQIKGAWFEAADGETQADFLQLMQAYGVYRCTRLDFQQTSRTTNRLTPWWIKKFEVGDFRVIGKKHYEPRGLKTADGDYPHGATLYHGSRTSERFARQYDKHLQSDFGPPRRRDEIEVKGQTARDLWTSMHEELLLTGTTRDFQRRDTALIQQGHDPSPLPIRDTSRWRGNQLPQKWAQVATEPSTWATLFDDDPIQVKPRERKVTHLLKSYRYAGDNFGSAVSVMFCKYLEEEQELGTERSVASENAYSRIVDEMFLGANEERVDAFCGELAPSLGKRVKATWLAMLRTAASNLEEFRD